MPDSVELNKTQVDINAEIKYRIGYQVYDHERRIAALETGIQEVRQAVTKIETSLVGISTAIENQNVAFRAQITEQFLRHEAREFAMQQKVMAYSITTLITALGALAYYVISNLNLMHS